jgi:hypothetical protein
VAPRGSFVRDTKTPCRVSLRGIRMSVSIRVFSLSSVLLHSTETGQRESPAEIIVAIVNSTGSGLFCWRSGWNRLKPSFGATVLDETSTPLLRVARSFNFIDEIPELRAYVTSEAYQVLVEAIIPQCVSNFSPVTNRNAFMTLSYCLPSKIALTSHHSLMTCYMPAVKSEVTLAKTQRKMAGSRYGGSPFYWDSASANATTWTAGAPQTAQTRPPCRFWASSGGCMRGDGCFYFHDPEAVAPSVAQYTRRPSEGLAAAPSFSSSAPSSMSSASSASSVSPTLEPLSDTFGEGAEQYVRVMGALLRAERSEQGAFVVQLEGFSGVHAYDTMEKHIKKTLPLFASSPRHIPVLEALGITCLPDAAAQAEAHHTASDPLEATLAWYLLDRLRAVDGDMGVPNKALAEAIGATWPSRRTEPPRPAPENSRTCCRPTRPSCTDKQRTVRNKSA